MRQSVCAALRHCRRPAGRLVICLATGQFQRVEASLAPALPGFTLPHFTLQSLLGIGLPFFLVTMASQNAPGIATLKASGYPVPVSPLMTFTGLTGLIMAPFGVFSICIAAITAAICQSPDAHPDSAKRWLASSAAGVFYLLAGVFGGAIAALMNALPLAGIQMLAGLALLGTLSGSLHQALSHETERDAAIVTFLITASGMNLAGISAAFWGLLGGGACYAILAAARKKRAG
ncbi:putative benzoate transporter [Atlantibacter hermannii]|nr:putative benzoate transporter [Atlantibacter hermannii]